MSNIIVFYLFIFGLCVGSFLNVVIDRIPHGISILHGRSHCDTCHHLLTWIDLVPVLSFVGLRGKCRYCKTKLSFQYPLIEILTGMLFVISFMLLGNPTDSIGFVKAFILIAIFSTFFALSIMDIKYGILSDKLVFVAIALSLVLLLSSPSVLLAHLLVGFVCLGALLLLFLVTRGRGIGFGDVKVAFVMGLFLGFPSIIVALYLAFLTGALVAIILVIAKRKKLVGGTIAFGPFLLLGTYISWFFGNTLWVLFLHLLGFL